MNGHGGARKNAGRKPKPLRLATEYARVQGIIAPTLPELIEILITLARGGLEVIERTYQPAGTISVGNGAAPLLPFLNKDGSNKDELVLVKQVTRHTLPDRTAAEYLIDRMLGKPHIGDPPQPKKPSTATTATPVRIWIPDNGRVCQDPEAPEPTKAP